MEVTRLKERIIEESKIEEILESIGCHHIVQHGSYITCGNPDGDNKSAITVYCDSENLTVVNYTRNILEGQTRATDIIDLVSWVKKLNFVETLKYLCIICGLDYYEEEEELPESLRILKMLNEMAMEDNDNEEDKPIKPISEKILDYYLPYGNIMFERDGISLNTQRFWGIEYDPQSNHIIIPIRDETGNLVGIKGRIFKWHLDERENKYIYLYNCQKGRILYGLDKNINNIIEQGCVYVVESEKAVMQLWEQGYYAIATGGATVSKYQIDMITRLGVKIIFAFDQDIDEDRLKSISNLFVEGVPVYAIVDSDDLLNEKESPSDDAQKWQMLQKYIKKIR